jgi:hypothetical protein
MQQRGVHRRHAFKHRHAIAFDHRERLAGSEPRDQREPRAGADRRVQATRLTKGVKQRQRTEDNVLRTECKEPLAGMALTIQFVA